MAVTTETTTSERPTFQEAFAAAKEEHSKAAADEQAPGQEASTDDEAETDTSPSHTTAAAVATAETATSKPETTDLLTDEEFKTLQSKHANDPVALRKALVGAFTKKTQGLAEERKTYERMKPYVELIDAYEEDPEGVLTRLAAESGFSLVAKGAKPAGDTPAGETAATADAVDEVMTEFRESLGPELEYLADGLAPAITKLVERLTQTTGEKAVAPLKEQVDSLLGKAAQDQTDVVMKAFETAHPDWKEHEPAMMKLAARVQPKGMTESEYLEHLYANVTRDAWEKNRDTEIAEAVKRRVAKMTKGAEETETREESTPEHQVRKRPAGPVDFRQAYEDAKRGIRYED